MQINIDSAGAFQKEELRAEGVRPELKKNKNAKASGKNASPSSKSKKPSKSAKRSSASKAKNKDKIQKSNALILHDTIEKKGRAAPLPTNYPYKRRMRRATYEVRKQELQIELLKVQNWVKDTGQRVLCIF